MQRRRGQQQTEVRVVRRDLDGEGLPRAGQAGKQDDRRLGCSEQSSRLRGHFTQLARLLDVAHHDGEGFDGPALRCAQPGEGCRVRGVGHEMEAPQALHGDDLAGPQRGDGRPQGVRRAVAGDAQARTARRAGSGLRMVAAVACILVLAAAGRAQGEAPHGGVGSIVRQRRDDAEARPAMRAVGERIAVAPVGGIEHFRQAVRAGRHVGQDERRHRPGRVAGADLEGGRVFGWQDVRLDQEQARERRGLGLHAGKKGVERGIGALDLDGHAVRVVKDPAGQPELGRQPGDERPEAHPLDRALDFDAPAGQRRVVDARRRV